MDGSGSGLLKPGSIRIRIQNTGKNSFVISGNIGLEPEPKYKISAPQHWSSKTNQNVALCVVDPDSTGSEFAKLGLVMIGLIFCCFKRRKAIDDKLCFLFPQVNPGEGLGDFHLINSFLLYIFLNLPNIITKVLRSSLETFKQKFSPFWIRIWLGIRNFSHGYNLFVQNKLL